MDGAFYCRSELTAPWGLTLPPMPGYLWFHVVTAGRAAGSRWTMAPSRCGAARRPRARPARRRPRAALASRASAAPGILDLEREEVSPALRDPPPRRRRRADRSSSAAPCASTTRRPARSSPSLPRDDHDRAADLARLDGGHAGLMAAEARDLQPGGEAVITRLADILVIQAHPRLARDATRPRGRAGSARCSDPQVGRAITLIHREPARDWTVASLAARARDVALRVRRPLHRAGRRAGDAVRHALAHAAGPARAQGRGRPSASSPTGSATAPRPPSRVRSSA